AMAFVELDVPALELARRRVEVAGRVRDDDRERIPPAGLAIVGDVDLVGEAGDAVHLRGAADAARGGVDHRVGGDAGALHLRAIPAVIVICQVTADRALAGPSGDGEGRLAVIGLDQ